MKPIRFQLNGSITKAFCLMLLLSVNSCSEDEMSSNCEGTIFNVGQSEAKNIAPEDLNSSYVSSQSASNIATAFWIELNGQTRSTSDSTAYELNLICKDNIPQMYVINFENGGFVIVSATRTYYPILAYSDEGNYPVGQESDGLKIWLEETETSITNSYQQDDSLKTVIQFLWNQYEPQENYIDKESTRAGGTQTGELACLQRLEYYYRLTSGSGGWSFAPLSQAGSVFANLGLSADYESLCFRAQINNSAPNETVVGWKIVREEDIYGPFINTHWHQRSPYNERIENLAGCGTIAVAQLMNYYQHPSFLFTINPTDSDIANLIEYVYYHINSVYVNCFFTEFTYTRSDDLLNGLQDMGYNASEYDDDTCDLILELWNRRPVIMFGNANNNPDIGDIGYMGSSHYWICDGVKDTEYYLIYFAEWQPYGNGSFEPGWYSFESPDRVGSNNNYRHFHMNWGWGGGYDGWYLGHSADYGSIDYRYNRKNYYISVAN